MSPIPRDTSLLESELRSFGRRRGRTASPRQRKLLDEGLPQLGFDLARPAHEQIDLERETWLEIGFGGAEHLLWQARSKPEVTIIGCEPFEDGVVKALSGIEADALTNIRLYADDARPLLRWLPPGSITRAFVLFPDPWPKKKHVKRRLVNPQTLDLLARVLKPGAELRIATDIGDYARTILLAVMGHSEFDWPARGPEDWRERGPDWPPTRYEEKAVREGRRSAYFRFRRT
ncbi:MAG: tRNA (guanine(46)-N(7))-methyltransferase TrmB [Hyphomicrobiaceae bacterium]|nr:tRNA (guanine(46)-N(7))-methyltransferase TrmB [Hyphomicrobiaceae bacterium]